MPQYQTTIINEKYLKKCDKLIKTLRDDGVFWVIMNEDPKNLNTFKTIEYLSKKGLKLKNIILWINKFNKTLPPIINLHRSILFFVKSDSYFFNKDQIREKHIWKDIEWGSRKKNYNPLGKDPGNVWIRTIDDGKGKIIKFDPLNFKEIIERIILCSSKKGDFIFINLDSKINLKNFGRKIKNE